VQLHPPTSWTHLIKFVEANCSVVIGISWQCTCGW